MNKELEALNYLVNLAVVGNKENHRGKIFESEEIVIKALKRNEPMEVEIGTLKHFKFPICPNCKGELNEYYKNKYCKDCGQRLDWRKV